MPSLSQVKEKPLGRNAAGDITENAASGNEPAARAGSVLIIAGMIGIYLLTCATLLMLSLARTQWHLVYPLDDAYIHMAIAKNLAQHGVWGVTSHEFTSCSSSPLWII